MSTSTGIHILGNTLNVVCLKKSENGYHLTGLLNHTLSTSFDFDQDSGPSQTLIDEFNQVLNTNLPTPLPPISIALTGGLYHIQKVPLEVAGKEDRDDQIEWEAAQALISPSQDRIIDFIPAGRVAFWTAMHKRVIDAHETLCHAITDVSLSFTVEPLALFYAGHPTDAWQPGRQAAIHLAKPWSSLVSVEDGLLTAAETVRAADHSGTQSHQIRQWISGDLTGSRPPYSEVFLSGEANDIPLDDISHTTDITFSAYPGFQNIDTTQLANPPGNECASKFTIAIGAAIHHIAQKETGDNV